MGQEGLHFGAEQQALGEPGVIEGLDPQAVPGQEQALFAAVPDGEGEHAVHGLQAVGAVFLVGVDDHLGVARGGEAVAGLDEIGPDFRVIVQLAVVDDPDSLVFVGQGLMPGLKIDDGQAAVA